MSTAIDIDAQDPLLLSGPAGPAVDAAATAARPGPTEVPTTSTATSHLARVLRAACELADVCFSIGALLAVTAACDHGHPHALFLTVLALHAVILHIAIPYLSWIIGPAARAPDHVLAGTREFLSEGLNMCVAYAVLSLVSSSSAPTSDDCANPPALRGATISWVALHAVSALAPPVHALWTTAVAPRLGWTALWSAASDRTRRGLRLAARRAFFDLALPLAFMLGVVVFTRIDLADWLAQCRPLPTLPGAMVALAALVLLVFPLAAYATLVAERPEIETEIQSSVWIAALRRAQSPLQWILVLVYELARSYGYIVLLCLDTSVTSTSLVKETLTHLGRVLEVLAVQVILDLNLHWHLLSWIVVPLAPAALLIPLDYALYYWHGSRPAAAGVDLDHLRGPWWSRLAMYMVLDPAPVDVGDDLKRQQDTCRLARVVPTAYPGSLDPPGSSPSTIIDIDGLPPSPMTRHVSSELDLVLPAEDARCVICMCDYAASERIHRLPCAHHGHADCLVRWLAVAPLCPLCLRNVETMLAARATPLPTDSSA
ncbi:hypothetical protein H9P43_006028 [Blastocladiella emersonii ATCC 22665]|nr:hypothetical protein H9P43_006004 [Blastocladiella emersonii ATCC 22665]KAI9175664.1 hypothetical protein H9P43_006028 [Blastocladiella emersonii ATCC 22665]